MHFVLTNYIFMFNIILFGPPGSGKGTQSELLINNFGLTHISTGDVLRSEIEGGTKLGIEAKKYMDDGQLVPDEVVIGMIEELVRNNKEAKGFIFDGFPRTTAQAAALDAFLAANNMPIDVLVSLDVPEEELKTRLIERGKVSGRSDDNAEVILQRIQEYYNKTKAVEDHYAAQSKLAKIEGVGSVESIASSIAKVIERLTPVK